jgi:hypothetical protein
MDASKIEQFLRLINAENIRRDDSCGWIMASCPLAKWLHEKGTDKKPSFGVKIPDSPDGAPSFHCFTCEASGRLPRLLHDLVQLSGDRMAEASNFLSQLPLFESDQEDARFPRRIKFADRYESSRFLERGVKKNIPVPSEVLARYPLLAEQCSLTAHAEALTWLFRDRKISLRAIEQYKLRLYVDPIIDGAGVIFPILSRDGSQVLDLWVRLIGRKKFFRLTREYTGCSVDYKAPNLWFGNHLYRTGDPVALVEGALDALRLYSLGIENVLASFGEPSREQIESLYVPAAVLGYDNDSAGAAFTKKLVLTLQAPSISILDWGVAGRKDAGDLESEAEFRAVYDARRKILRSEKTKTERKSK